ncbi:hypothetical protein HYH02_010030 [Chlamydomonas schloesseri]|uniref:WPP domain-containing protein n=1 Tax=Chlamydomonas schloesseri TaxID=2026947 RepID=A0A835TM17_9CHLO|nr:hypothetical protein HYH02_010030 [Chlamydomonas schloesseri]|eukprot:KAG2441186.1 hypothetical protein HYH02_010030 [Chlamydomonas schloesseri]
MTQTWSLTPAQREDVVSRLVSNICALAHVQGLELSAEVAAVAAAAIEKKAYTAAEVAARTTTGNRPLAETTSGYARKLGELVIQTVKDGGKVEGVAMPGAAAAAGTVTHVDLAGSRDFLTADATEQLLAALLAPGSSVSTIRFSTKSFGRDAAAVAARAIAAVSGVLREADISDVIAGRPEDEALEVLRVLSGALAGAPQLTALNLSDNALGEKGVRACEAVLKGNAPLESLSLQNVGLSVHACRATAELLADPSRLRRLQLFNNMSGDEGATHIAGLLARAPRMEDIRFASSRVGPAGGIALAKSLMAGSCLVRLDFSDNPLTAEVAPALAAALAGQPALRALNLNDTGLGPDGVATLCGGLLQSYAAAEAAGRPRQQLEELGLALNEVDPDAAKAVAALVAAHARSLRSVNLRENELGDRGAVTLARALAVLAAPQSVDLVGNQIRRVGAVAAAKAVAGKASLQLLALDENEISEAGLDELRSVMAAAGKAAALGPLDENMEEDDEEEEEEEDAGDDFGLAQLLSRAAAIN